MKIVIVGAGAVGTYFGAALALGGHDVTFGVRDTSRSGIESDGLRLTGPRGDLHVRSVKHTNEAGRATGADILLSTVKLYDVTSSAEQWRPAIETAGAVLSLQNGVDGVQRLLAGAPAARVFGGIAFVSGRATAPGYVEYLSDMSSLTFGGTGSAANDALTAFSICLDAAPNPLNVRFQPVNDIKLARWAKFLALATNAALTCLVRCGAGVIYHDGDLLELACKSIDEIFAVGHAEGVALTDEHRARAVEMLQALPPTMMASMSHDLTAGRRLELDGFSGLVSRLGCKHQIDTPFHDFAYACLKPHIAGAGEGNAMMLS